MAISLEEVQKVAKLARLNLTPAEERKYAAELTAILSYVEQLKGVGASEMSGQWENIHTLADLRPDQSDGGRRQNEILAIAPTRKDNFLTVPTVF